MGAGASIVVIAVGAIMRYAVKVNHSHGFDVHRIGLILLIVGIVGFVISLLFWRSWGGVGSYRRTRVVTERRRTSDGRIVEEPVDVVEEHRRY